MIFYTQLSRRFLWVFMLFMLQLHNKLLQLQPNSSKSTQQESSQKHEDEEEEATLNAANLPHDHTAAVLTRRQSTESADAWQNENGWKAAAGRLEVWKSEKQNRNVPHYHIVSLYIYISLFIIIQWWIMIYIYMTMSGSYMATTWRSKPLDGHVMTRHGWEKFFRITARGSTVKLSRCDHSVDLSPAKCSPVDAENGWKWRVVLWYSNFSHDFFPSSNSWRGLI